MATVDILNSDDVVALYGDTNTMVDLTTPAPFSNVVVAGSGHTTPLSPVSRTYPERYPITARTGVAADGFDGDTLQSVETVDDDTGAVAVLLTASNRGWIVPGAVFDIPGKHAQTQHPTTGVILTAVMWEPTAQSRIVDNIIALDGSTAVTVPALSGRQVWLALTTAGSVDGSARTVGVYSTGIAAGSAAVAGAVGYLLVARLHKAAGV